MLIHMFKIKWFFFWKNLAMCSAGYGISRGHVWLMSSSNNICSARTDKPLRRSIKHLNRRIIHSNNHFFLIETMPMLFSSFRNLRPLWYYLNNQIECRLIGGNRAKSASICILPWASLKLILIKKTFLMWKGQRKLNLILD